MNPEAVTIEIALVEAIRLLELALLAGDVTTEAVSIVNTMALDLCKTDLSAPDHEQTLDLAIAAMKLHYTTAGTLGLMRPLIVAFVEAQKAALRERTNVNAMH